MRRCYTKTIIMKFLLFLLLTFNLSVVFATEWNCRNQDMEISCHLGQCQVSDSFTPLDVFFNDVTGELNVGMYSGVWQGRGMIIKDKDYLIIIAADMKLSTSGKGNDFLIILDRNDNVALIKGGGFAMPMNCKVRNS